MAALDLTNRTAVLAYLTAQLPNETASVLETLLDESAADDCADTPVTTYRPFWVIANTLQTNQALAESVGSASGASITYRDPVGAFRAIMRRQQALDKALCNIPEGFEATLPGGVSSGVLTRTYA